MAEIEILPQKIVDTRNVILKSRLDSNRVKFQGEKLKTSFFVRFGFLKPKPKDVLLIAFSKYYEPYVVIGGKYSIDYCKRHGYALQVEDRTQALFIDGKKLKPEPLSVEGDARVIKLVGEEHSHYQNESYIVLDRMLQEVSPENLSFAPSESELENQDGDFDLRKPQISLDEEIAFLRSKIAKRPADVAEIVREMFEITERTIIYSPVYELTYKNLKNGKRVTVLINGVTGGMVLGKFDKASRKLGDSLGASPENFVTTQTRFFRAEPEQSPIHDDSYITSSASKIPAENLIVEERVSNVATTPHQTQSAFRSNAENTTHVATNFMTRLGYKQGQFPTKMYLDGETNVVELQLQDGTARVQIDPKTKEVKGYEIQEAEAEEGFFASRRKLLFLLSSVVAVIAVVLKLVNVF
jgi:hypothetical protein